MVKGTEAERLARAAEAAHREWFELLKGGVPAEAARGLLAALPEALGPDARDGGGTTLLILSSSCGNFEFCELLLAAGADPRARDKFGRTAAAVFGDDCYGTSDFPRPSFETAARAKELFAAAAGHDGPPPGRHRIIFREERLGAGATIEVEALQTFWADVQDPRATPYPMRDAMDIRRGLIWLLPGEVRREKTLLRAAAARARLGRAFTFAEAP